MRVWELLELLGKFVVFVCKYGFSKCMRPAVCGLAVMLLLLTWHCWRKRRAGRSADLGFYSWLLLFPAAFTGMSRIFFQRWSIGLQGGIHILGDTWVSGGYFVILLALLGWWLAGKHVLSKRVCKLYCWYAPKMSSHRGTQDWQHCIRRVTDGDRRGLARWYLKRARVYFRPGDQSLLRRYLPALYCDAGSISGTDGGEFGCRGRTTLQGKNNVAGEVSNVAGQVSNVAGQVSSVAGQVSNIAGELNSSAGKGNRRNPGEISKQTGSRGIGAGDLRNRGRPCCVMSCCI